MVAQTIVASGGDEGATEFGNIEVLDIPEDLLANLEDALPGA